MLILSKIIQGPIWVHLFSHEGIDQPNLNGDVNKDLRIHMSIYFLSEA